MEKIFIKTEYIKLDQLLKYCGEVQRGCDAKEIIKSGDVKVNGESEIKRGRKIRKGDIILYNDKEFKIE